MPNGQHTKTNTLRYALAYAGTLALVATVALFPSAVNETVVAQLRGFSFVQESVSATGQLTIQTSRSNAQSLTAWLMLLVLFGSCLVGASAKAQAQFASFAPSHYQTRVVQKSHYLIPEIRGPSL